MKYSKFAAVTLVVLLALSVLCGCGTKENAQSGAISLTDMAGNTVSLDAPATKVVALTASDCEIIYALGAGDAIVGRGEYCDYPEEVLNVTMVQSGSTTNVEEIIALEPQLVIMSTMAQTEEQVAALQEAGIQVAVSDAQDINGVYDAVKMIGTLLGKDSEADALVTSMMGAFSDIEAKADKDGSETVYFEVSPLEYGLWTSGSGTFMDELAQMVGLKNAFADVEGWGEISEEQVIERNPDYIVTIAMYFGEGPTPEEEIASRKGWEDITAVKEGRILNADSNEISRPGPRLADAAATLYDFVYGETTAE